MPKIPGFLCLLLLTFVVISGQTINPVEGQTKAKSPAAGNTQLQKTQVLVLGTSHLSAIRECFSPDALTSLLLELRRFAPDAIAVEKVSSADIEEMEWRSGFYSEIVDVFDGDRFKAGKQMQKFLSLSRSQAEKRAETFLLRADTINDTERIELIKLLIASYEYSTAVLQWSYLTNRTGIESGVLPENIADELNRNQPSANEIYSIGANLARSTGLSRLYYIDDHYDETLLNEFSDELITQLKDNSEHKALASSTFHAETMKELKEACRDGEKMLNHYRRLNSQEYGKKDVEEQWDVWLRTKLPSGLDRRRLALWEMRNLRIAANIRELSARYPGKKILIIIGAGHKPFLESYLTKMIDLELVGFESIVKPDRK